MEKSWLYSVNQETLLMAVSNGSWEAEGWEIATIGKLRPNDLEAASAQELFPDYLFWELFGRTGSIIISAEGE